MVLPFGGQKCLEFGSCFTSALADPAFSEHASARGSDWCFNGSDSAATKEHQTLQIIWPLQKGTTVVRLN